jgi:hypothetical protein
METNLAELSLNFSFFLYLCKNSNTRHFITSELLLSYLCMACKLYEKHLHIFLEQKYCVSTCRYCYCFLVFHILDYVYMDFKTLILMELIYINKVGILWSSGLHRGYPDHLTFTYTSTTFQS